MEKLVRFQIPAGINYSIYRQSTFTRNPDWNLQARHDLFARDKQLKLILLLPPASCTGAWAVLVTPWPTMWTPQGSCAAGDFVSLARSSAPRSTFVSSNSDFDVEII